LSRENPQKPLSNPKKEKAPAHARATFEEERRESLERE
jgi:hypothetical protein